MWLSTRRRKCCHVVVTIARESQNGPAAVRTNYLIASERRSKLKFMTTYLQWSCMYHVQCTDMATTALKTWHTRTS